MHCAEDKFSMISSNRFLWSFCVNPVDGGTVITVEESL